MGDQHLPAVGTRFSFGSFRGTVRYVGEVPPTQGTWLGVEWDDANRGKHSGIHNDVKYFTCRVSGSGSFIRPSSKLSFGSSFLQAIKAKYAVDVEKPLIPSLEEPATRQYTRKNLADIEVEAPNMDGVIQRTSQLHKLRQVGLGGWKREADSQDNAKEPESYAEVARAFDLEKQERPGDIQKTCSRIKGLDLSRSLLPSWLELSKITAELPLLESLLLHFNRFEELSSGTMPTIDAFRILHDLQIDGTRIDWKEIVTLSRHFPALESLQMGFNGITMLGAPHTITPFVNLRSLNLEGNSLNDWEDIWLSLKATPNLKRLILSFNAVGNIARVVRQEEHVTLQHISLWENPIASWSDLDALDDCVGGLKSLVLGGNACILTNSIEAHQIRPLVAARLASLQVFNNAPIRPAERRDAELFYLSHVDKQNFVSDEDRDSLHPRWKALCQIHGAPIKRDADTTETNGTLRSKLLTVKVNLCNEPPSSIPPCIPSSAQQLELNLLTTTPLRLIISKLTRSFSLKKERKSIQSIWALLSPIMDPTQATAEALRRELRPNEANSDERIIYQMDNLERDLQGYNFSVGDEIVLVVESSTK